MDRGVWQAIVHGVAKELGAIEHTHYSKLSPFYQIVIVSREDSAQMGRYLLRNTQGNGAKIFFLGKDYGL